MAEGSQPAGDSRRKGKKNRSRQGTQKRKRAKSRSNHRNPTQSRYNPEPIRDESSILGARVIKTPERRAGPNEGPPDAFALFCAYHLGITPDDGYQKPELEAVARRFGMNGGELRDLLKEHQIDDESLRQSDFDLEGAKLDIRLAPQGISRTETARDLYQELLDLQQAAAVD